MTDIRILPPQAARVETGPVQFGDDWPGVFIRGDNAMGYVLDLDQAAQILSSNPMLAMGLRSLSRLLSRSSTVPFPPPAITPPWQPLALEPHPECSKCGLKLDGVLSYTCGHAGCPSGLGGATSCTMGATPG